MTQHTHEIRVSTRGQGLYEFTTDAVLWIRSTKVRTGLLTLFCRHTSASLVIQENADPDVQTDLQRAYERIAPEDNRLYVHTIEGPDDMPAHVRAAITGVNLSIPVVDGRPALGTWQGIYLFEHRTAPHTRSIVLHLLGE